MRKVGDVHLRHRLARVCDFVRVRVSRKAAGTAVHVPPPPDVVQDVLAAGAWPFPAVDAVTAVPVLRPWRRPAGLALIALGVLLVRDGRAAQSPPPSQAPKPKGAPSAAAEATLFPPHAEG
jgi:hypothetical protein